MTIARSNGLSSAASLIIAGSAFHHKAAAFLNSLAANPDVVIAELVLVELYLALRNPSIVHPELKPTAAVEQCRLFRQHPRWQIVEVESVMDEVWEIAKRSGFARRRIIDARLALTLKKHGVRQFATANLKDFSDFGFERVWNPLTQNI